MTAPAPAPPAEARPPVRTLDIIQVLQTAVERAGSDIIFTVGTKPRIRLGGRLRTYGDEVLTPEICKKMLYSLLSDDQKAHFEEHWEIDLAVNIRGVGRFRLNGFRQRGCVGCALRSIPNKVPTVAQLELPQSIVDLAESPRGLILVTGPTGSGKSTLLASLINKINSERDCHIITVEDPVEFVHPHIRAAVEQREVGVDTKSYGNALKYILRQNPDVILLGEMRDPETISAGLSLAETGHLVFSTLHTQNCAQTMDRIIDSFPPNAQGQVRSQLSLTLRAVISQTLLPALQGDRCQAAREIMIVTPGISALIREGKQHMITNSIQTGRQQGMITMEASIEELVNANLVDPKVAKARINQIRSYTGKDSDGGASAIPKVVQEEVTEVTGPLDIDASAEPLVKDTAKSDVPKAPPPELDSPVQPGFLAVVLLAVGAAAYLHLKMPTKQIAGFVAAGVLALVWAVRFFLKSKSNKEEIRRWMEENAD